MCGLYNQVRHQDVDNVVHDATAVLCPLTIPTPPQHHPSHATLDVPHLVALSRATVPLTFDEPTTDSRC